MTDRSIVALTRPMDRVRAKIEELAERAPVVHIDPPAAGVDPADVYQVEAALRRAAISAEAEYSRAVRDADWLAADRAVAALCAAVRAEANALLEANQRGVVRHQARATALGRLLRTS
jgi:hypothetical protein